MGELSFSLNEFVWSVANLVILGILIVLPIWLVRKIVSIDNALKEILRKLDK